MLSWNHLFLVVMFCQRGTWTSQTLIEFLTLWDPNMVVWVWNLWISHWIPLNKPCTSHSKTSHDNGDMMIETFKTEIIVINGTDFWRDQTIQMPHLEVQFSRVGHLMTPVTVRLWNLVFFQKTQRFAERWWCLLRRRWLWWRIWGWFRRSRGLGRVILGPPSRQKKRNGPSWVVGLWLCFSFFCLGVFFVFLQLQNIELSWNSGRFK